MDIAIIIILALLLLYILFIVIPSVILFNFAFGRKECSIPLSESGDLRGTRYEPYQTELIAADTYVRSHPMERVSVTAKALRAWDWLSCVKSSCSIRVTAP